MAKQTSIRCTVMRGGTSKGPFFMARDLPTGTELRDKVLLRVMGSPDVNQIDGIGGATPVTSKVAIVSKSEHSWAEIDYLFAQIDIQNAKVDTAPTCGNMMAGVAAFAVENGLVAAKESETSVKIRNVNTNSLIEAVIQTPNGEVVYDGDCKISGVPGTAAAVTLKFRNIIGSKTGKLLPTGNVLDKVDGLLVSCIDVAMPMVIVKATDCNVTCTEAASELHNNSELMKKLEVIRLKAGDLMGFGDVSDSVVPKIGLVSAPHNGGNLSARYFTPKRCHPSFAVSGAMCLAYAATMKDSIVEQVVNKNSPNFPEEVYIEHPQGDLKIVLEIDDKSSPNLLSASILRTTRKLLEGLVYVPSSVWNGHY